MRTQWMLAAAAAGVCLAVAAPAGLGSAETPGEVISRLQNEGYTVNIDRIGTAPTSECVVTNIRNPKQVKQWLPYTGPGARDDRVLIEVVTSQTISVSLDCSRSR